MRILFTAIVVCASLTSLLDAQSSAPTPAGDQAAPPTLPAAPAPATANSNPFVNLSAPVPAFNYGTSTVGQNQPSILFGEKGIRFRPGGSSGMDTFQPTPNFGNFNGSSEFNPFGGSAIDGRQGSFGPPFPASYGPTRIAGGPFGSAPAAQPSLNQMMRRSFSLPFSSSSSSFHFSYLDTLRPGGTLGDLGHPTAAAMFTTSDLGNGVFLSAGTGYGIRSTAGAPAASLGNEGGPKHSGTAVNVKLSF